MAGSGMTSAVFDLPFPPSANGLFAGKRRRYISPAYERWRTAAGWELLAQKVRSVAGPVSIDIALCAPDNRRRDADNANKPILDLLVEHKLIEDDSKHVVRAVTSRWTEHDRPGARVTITPA